jgi:cytochrome c-type biogenesis protein
MDIGSIGLAFVAGTLSTLSPCVLPLLPIVLGSAAAEHRRGPLALAAGLALSFTLVGLTVATLGFALGLNEGVFRTVGGLLMLALGAVLLVPQAQARFALAAGPIGQFAETRLGGFSSAGLTGQFGVGLLLGLVWSPCVGPTLGAASLLAAKGEQLPLVAPAMASFGLGAGTPLVLLGLLSRDAMMRLRGRLLGAAQRGKLVLGGLFVALALMILTGADKRLEASLVELSPAWLTALTTRF